MPWLLTSSSQLFSFAEIKTWNSTFFFFNLKGVLSIFGSASAGVLLGWPNQALVIR